MKNYTFSSGAQRRNNAAAVQRRAGVGAPGSNNSSKKDGDTYTRVVGKARPPTAAEKMGNSLKGFLLGPILIVLGCLLLWNNESWAIKTYRSLNEALDAYVSLDSSSSSLSHNEQQQQYENRLVHVSGPLQVDDPVVDPQFDLSRNQAVSLTRTVEICQWVETIKRKQQDGQDQVVEHVRYQKKWVEAPINSEHFRRSGYENVGDLPFATKTFRADTVLLEHNNNNSNSNIILDNQALVSQLHSKRDVSVREIPQLPEGASIAGNHIVFLRPKTLNDNVSPEEMVEEQTVRVDGQDKTFYVVKDSGESYSTLERALEAVQAQLEQQQLQEQRQVGGELSGYEPEIGDVRVRFQEVPCTTVSVVAQLQSSSGNNKILTNWPSRYGSGYDVAILQTGVVSAADMISNAQTANTVKTWLFRGGGWLLNMIGFSLITDIVSTTADIGFSWIPLLGPMATSIIRLGVSIANFILGTCLSLLVASIAWIVYRPVLGVSMLVGSLGLFVTASRVGNNRNKGGGGAAAAGGGGKTTSATDKDETVKKE